MQVKAEIVGPDTYDPQAEHEAFQKALSKKPTAILVSVSDPNVIKGDIDSAISQGIPVVTIDSDAPSSKRLLFVGTDNHAAGAMGGKILADRLHGKGNVVFYTIPGQANLVERMHGYKDVLDGYPGIKILDTVDMKGDARIAFDKTMEMMDKGIEGGRVSSASKLSRAPKSRRCSTARRRAARWWSPWTPTSARSKAFRRA